MRIRSLRIKGKRGDTKRILEQILPKLKPLRPPVLVQLDVVNAGR